MKKIRLADPWITKHEIDTVTKAMKTGWTNFEYVEKFQKEFATYHGRKYGIMTPNCTSAMHLLLLALGIKNNDEVIVPECTWTGSSAPITYVGAKPVFCDIDETNWCLDPISVDKNITKKTKAIIAIDLYGNMPDMKALTKIAKKHKIYLIEDAAEALGSTYKNIKAGKFGIGSVFSFHRTKTITTGEGGMLLLDDKKLYERAMFLRDHGRSKTIPYWIEEAAPKYTPFNIQAAIGYAQFQRINELVGKKRQILKWYKKHLANLKDIQLNQETKDIKNGAWITALVFGKSYGPNKKAVMASIEKQNLPARPFFYPLSSMPGYSKFKTGGKTKNPVSYDVSERGIILPAAFNLDENDIIRYCKAIKKALL